MRDASRLLKIPKQAATRRLCPHNAYRFLKIQKTVIALRRQRQLIHCPGQTEEPPLPSVFGIFLFYGGARVCAFCRRWSSSRTSMEFSASSGKTFDPNPPISL
jgi:hypothetical protein